MAAAATLRKIKVRFHQEMRNLKKLQQAESEKLSSLLEEANEDSPAQVHPDLNEAIASALASYIAPASPADYSFARSYGEVRDIESTRLEKSGSNDWNLLGLRGTEATQVSSHRGPPTDRPPDKPVETRVFAGCSGERPNTPCIHQLASFARSSHCSSGNVSSLAENAILGSHAIEQYCVHAVGTSHEVNRELSWMLPRCGRFRVNGIRVRASCRPSSNLGRNLFPPRRLSYHTRFSRFNGTARQPTH
jgi:hypothetical protein